MLWSFWRGVNSLFELPRASDEIDNNNIINTMLPAEMLHRIFRLIEIISSYINIMQFGYLDFTPSLKVGSKELFSRFLPPEDLKVAVTVCR